ncbi:MAG: alpha/beta hydrolase [Actinomycetota bacterium]
MTEVGIKAGVLDVEQSGSGDPVVFLHPFMTNRLHWRHVVPVLEPQMRCITPTLPLGSHRFPMRGDADLSPTGLAEIVVDLLDALGIQKATLVGNDTGGAIAQITAANHPDRVSRLVLTSCDAYDVFPPRMFSYLKVVARIPGAAWLLVQSLRVPGVTQLPIAYGWITSEPIPKDVMTTYITPARQREIRRDLNKVARSLDPRYTQEAAEKLKTFDGGTLIAWGGNDRFFPRRLAERLASEIPRAQLEIVEGARTLVPEDAPGRLAELIAKFVATT